MKNKTFKKLGISFLMIATIFVTLYSAKNIIVDPDPASVIPCVQNF